MNFQASPALHPLRVLVVNPLSPVSQLLIMKIMSGKIFGNNKPIDLTLLVYANERQVANEFKMELSNCAFSCMNSIEVSSNLPVISDSDVYCFITDLRNPNSIDITAKIDHDLFDVIYMLIKIANALLKPPPVLVESEPKPRKRYVVEEKPRKPIVMADGIVALNVLSYFLRDLPEDILFCSTPLPDIVRSTLGDHLGVQCNLLNGILVWAANDEIFHAEVERPLVIHDKVVNKNKCDWDMISKDLLKSVDLDHTQFSDSWLKKELIEKVLFFASKNPYGCIYRAAELSRSLQTIWKARIVGDEKKVYTSLGVISDGSLHTIKGCPYILPLVFSGDNWAINKRFEESSHLQQEIKRINKFVKDMNDKFRPFCNTFLQENVIDQAFIPDDDSESVYSFVEHSSRASSN